jgi:hypothetical protein
VAQVARPALLSERFKMPQILTREDEFRTRKGRQKELKRGPGTFVYDGSHLETHWTPTVLRRGKSEPKFTDEGEVAVDSEGEPIYERPGKVVTDMNGRPVLGGPPKVSKVEVSTKKIRGLSFPKGKPVFVRDAAFALKLRGMDGFEEVEGDEPKAEKSKRGKKSDKPEGDEPKVE